MRASRGCNSTPAPKGWSLRRAEKQEEPMAPFALRQSDSPHSRRSRRQIGALLLAAAVAAPCANAFAGARAAAAAQPNSGYGAPDWVLRECRPATGAEILGRFAGNGYYFYRDTGDFCYFDRRAGVL
jgi:hypothetical protein